MIGDCAACGRPVRQEIDGDGTVREVCTGYDCRISQKPFEGPLPRAEISAAVQESRRRRLLGPSCLGRRHTRCTAHLCECTCHPDQRPREPRRPDAPA